MTETELLETLSSNIKFYRKGRLTQEMLAEKIGVSTQQINHVEGMRRFPRTENLVKIAAALEVEVWQLFVPRDTPPPIIEETPENERIRAQITDEVVEEIRARVNKSLDKIRERGN